jgi:hypothetical protein
VLLTGLRNFRPFPPLTVQPFKVLSRLTAVNLATVSIAISASSGF